MGRAMTARVVIERIYTRDHVEHIGDGHWRHIPQPPDHDPRWRIFDLEHDCKTGWEREHIIEGNAMTRAAWTDLHGAAVLAEALAMQPRGRA
jgi:hypothetical protein